MEDKTTVRKNKQRIFTIPCVNRIGIFSPHIAFERRDTILGSNVCTLIFDFNSSSPEAGVRIDMSPDFIRDIIDVASGTVVLSKPLRLKKKVIRTVYDYTDILNLELGPEELFTPDELLAILVNTMPNEFDSGILDMSESDFRTISNIFFVRRKDRRIIAVDLSWNPRFGMYTLTTCNAKKNHKITNKNVTLFKKQ